MNPGPIRRLVGSAGLLALVPVALLMVSGRLDVVQGARRAAVVLVVTVVVGRVVSAYVRVVASRLRVQDRDRLERTASATGGPRPTKGAGD